MSSSVTDTFTQGGQTQLHKLHMIRQVIWTTLWLSLLVGFVLMTGLIFLKLSFNDVLMVITCQWAKYAVQYGNGASLFKNVLFPFPEGGTVVSCQWVVQDPAIIHFYHISTGIISSAFYRGLTAAGITFSGLSLYWIRKGIRRKEKKILSGATVVSVDELKKLVKKNASTFRLGGIPLRKDSETQHILVCGTTGTGKSTCFFELLPQIRALKQRAVVVDTTGEFVARYYRHDKDILINPFDARTQGWNPWVDCTTPYHYDEVASAFIPQTGGDKFWSDAARTVFAETLKLHAQNKEYDIKYMLEMLLTVPLRDLFNHLSTTPAASLVDPAGDRTAMSIRAHLSSYLKSLVYVNDQRSPFSIRKWVTEQQEEDQWVFITSTPDQRETLRPFLTALTGSAINALMSCIPDRERRLWFVIDELASLHKQEAIPKALAEIRKYGGCIVVGLQDIPQLQVCYGRAEAESLVSLLNTRVIFRNGHPDTARVMSQVLGEQEVQQAVEGMSYGSHQIRDGVTLNDQNKIKPVISPTDLMALDDLYAYLKLPGDLPVAKIRFEVSKSDSMTRSFVPVKNEH